MFFFSSTFKDKNIQQKKKTPRFSFKNGLKM